MSDPLGGADVAPTELEGRYELLELISSGGMGAVYRARHRRLDREVAIKVMSADLREDPSMRERFFTEARVASSLSHPNVVAVTDFGVDPSSGYFLVMELLPGESLRDRMRQQRVSARVACDVLEQVAWALRYIHLRGIVHCDLKPENIFLTHVESESRRRNHVKLIDFGLAFRSAGEALHLGGTPPYLAPERLRGHAPSSASDIYSLGVLFYEMVSGELPFSGSLFEVMERQLRGELPKPPSQLHGDTIEERTDEVILRALAPDPTQRQQSAESFLFELRTLMSMMGMRVRRVTRVSARTVRRAGGPSLALAAARATQVSREAHATLMRQLRRHPRAPTRVPVTLRGSDAREHRGTMENISEGGLFVTLHTPPPPGAEFDVALPVTTPEGTISISLRAVARWARSPSDSHPDAGCGFQWLDPGGTDHSRIERVVSQHDRT